MTRPLKVLVRDVSKKRPYLEDVELTDNAQEIVNDPEIDIVVELMGGLHPAFEYMMEAMKNGKHVVTANKDVVAQMGHELLDMAEAKGVDFRFEASVGGGIPIITPLKECLTGNRITEIMGIVNGTTNYMLTQMTEKGSDYAAVLKEAQEKGYAEANPAATNFLLTIKHTLHILYLKFIPYGINLTCKPPVTISFIES